MIRFVASYQFYDSQRFHSPQGIACGQNFWRPFDTGKQLLSCNIVYLGKDTNLQSKTWYTGIVELPYGELFPPYTKKINPMLSEPILLNTTYHFVCCEEVVGDCVLVSVKEIVWDEFDVNTKPRGTEGYYSYL